MLKKVSNSNGQEGFLLVFVLPLLVRKEALSKADYLVSGFLLKILTILLYLDF